MKRISRLFLLLVAAAFPVMATNGIVMDPLGVTLKNLQPQYTSLDQVHAILANVSDESIYLLPDDCGEAQILFAGRDYWEPSDYPNCPQSVNPIEIKSGDSYQIPNLVFRMKIDEAKFIEEKGALPGRFKLVIRFSLNPVYRNGLPQLKYIKEVSKEFAIVR